MSLFRRDIISINRKIQLQNIGADSEMDLVETPIFTGIVADVQMGSSTAKPNANLPGDTDVGTFATVFFRLPNGSVLVRDIIVDILGRRFQVLYPYFTVFQYQCVCKLEQL